MRFYMVWTFLCFGSYQRGHRCCDGIECVRPLSHKYNDEHIFARIPRCQRKGKRGYRKRTGLFQKRNSSARPGRKREEDTFDKDKLRTKSVLGAIMDR